MGSARCLSCSAPNRTGKMVDYLLRTNKAIRETLQPPHNVRRTSYWEVGNQIEFISCLVLQYSATLQLENYTKKCSSLVASFPSLCRVAVRTHSALYYSRTWIPCSTSKYSSLTKQLVPAYLKSAPPSPPAAFPTQRSAT